MRLGTTLLGIGITLMVAQTLLAQSNGFDMPGTPVGRPMLEQIGTRLPSVGTRLPTVGSQLPGYGSVPNIPAQAKTPKVDPNLVVAPYPTPNSEPDDFWDRLTARWLTLFGGENKAPAMYVPGISRRNRERKRERAHQQEELLRRQRD